MQRIQDPTASASVVAPPALSGPAGYFQPANPGITAATRVRYWWLTMIQEEFMNVLAAGGVSADTGATNFTQVATAIGNMIAAIPHGAAGWWSAGSYAFTVPAGVSSVIVEVWGGGSGSWASTTTIAGGGGSAGGFSKKRVSGLTPGATVTVTVGSGGTGGTTAPAAPTAGGVSSFGAYCSAGGGVVNPTGTTSNPYSGNLGGVGSGGDQNFNGDDGGTAVAAQGGEGGSAPTGGGTTNSGTTGRNGYAPGGGGSGACNPGGTAYNGGNGAAGAVVVRW